MATARDLIKGSLRLIGVTATGETPAANETSDALYSLNDLLDSWSNESLFIANKIREEFDLVSGQGSYTMGIGGNFNTSRAMKIEHALIQYSGAESYESPLEILTVDQYAGLGLKNTTSSVPTSLYQENTYPLDTLRLYPVPSEVKKLVLYSWKTLGNIASLNTEINFPPGYARALRYNLALELAAEYGRDPSGPVVIIAQESKAQIKRMNIKPHYLACDDAVLGRGTRGFNYRTGE